MGNVPILSILKPLTAMRFKGRLKQSGECLVFTGAKHKQGYGVVDVMWKGVRFPILTHRLAWALAHGEDPPNDLIVCHRCNNPPCCNPDHLYLGTHQDNANDMLAAGRQSRAKPMLGRTGASHPRSHPKEIRDKALAMIRSDLADGKGLNFLSVYRRIGVSPDALKKWWKAAGEK